MDNRLLSCSALYIFASLIPAPLAVAQWQTSTPPPPHQKQAGAVEKNLKVFDTLDFDVFK